MASPQASAALATQASRAGFRALSAGPSSVDRQFCARFWFRIWIFTIVRVVTVYHVRAVRAAAEDSTGVDVPGVGGCNDVRAGRVVLRCAGVRMRGVCVLHMLAICTRYVRFAGRARAAAGRSMTARGPGAPAAAATPPRAPAALPLRTPRPRPRALVLYHVLYRPRPLCFRYSITFTL